MDNSNKGYPELTVRQEHEILGRYFKSLGGQQGCYNISCDRCMLLIKDKICSCKPMHKLKYSEAYIKILMDWNKEHPQRTKSDVFKEKIANAENNVQIINAIREIYDFNGSQHFSLNKFLEALNSPAED